MNRGPVNIGFIGCGGHAIGSHAEVAKKLPKLFRITAAFDLDRKAAGRLAALSHGVFVAGSAEELLRRKNVEAVVIAVPHRFHLALARAAVKAGKHVLCEKPLWEGMFAEQGKKLLKSAALRGLVFTSCHPRRFDPAYLKVRALLKKYEKKFGRVMEFNFIFFYHHPSTKWKLKDNLLLDHMNHEIDLANFLLGYRAARLQRVKNNFDRYEVTGSRDDGVSISFAGYRRLKNRIYRNELSVVMERGRITLESVLKNGTVVSEITAENFDDGFLESARLRQGAKQAFLGVMKNFAGAIRGRSKNYLTAGELLTNTISCNELVAKGKYDGPKDPLA